MVHGRQNSNLYRPRCECSLNDLTTHTRTGFDGSETAHRQPYLEQAKEIDGPILILTDVENRCAFGRFSDPNGSVWTQVSDADDPDVRSAFLRQVGDCPSGRLVAWDRGTGKTVEHKLAISIGLVEVPEEDCSGPICCAAALRSNRRMGS
jgi:hypothetical protein